MKTLLYKVGENCLLKYSKIHIKMGQNDIAKYFSAHVFIIRWHESCNEFIYIIH